MIKTRKLVRKYTRRMLAVIVVGMLISMGSSLWAQQEASESSNDLQPTTNVLAITISGDINTGSASYILDAIDEAEKVNFSCLLIELDTPGGGLDQTQDIVKKMLNSRVPIIVYVSPRGAQAASAGTFITMAAHVAVMAPGTRIGAAHPVFMPMFPGQGDEDDNKEKAKKRDYMMEKVENDTVSFVVGIAKQRGRNQEWAEKSVRESVSITSDEAVKINVVDFEIGSVAALLAKVDGQEIKIDESKTVVLKTQGAKIESRKMTLKQRLLNFLANPNIMMILMTLGGLGLLMEFYHPGSIFPGVIGVICLLMALTSMQILPVNWGGLVLILVGIALFIAEAYVTSYGLLGVGGAICFLVGGILVIDPSTEPHYLDPAMAVDWSVLITLVVTMGLIFVYIGYYVVKSQRSKIETGVDGMQGLVGEARSDISADEGMVFVRGEIWKAVSKEPITKGSKIEIVAVDGLLLQVRKKD
jgi:membrane-bound serine protease (ClpP class)